MENPAAHLSEKDFLNLFPAGKPVLIDFYATWCEPCNYLDEILAELEPRLGDNALIFKLDIDEQAELARHYHIMSVPTLMIFKDGELKWRMAGFKLLHELEAEVKNYY